MGQKQKNNTYVKGLRWVNKARHLGWFALQRAGHSYFCSISTRGAPALFYESNTWQKYKFILFSYICAYNFDKGSEIAKLREKCNSLCNRSKNYPDFYCFEVTLHQTNLEQEMTAKYLDVHPGKISRKMLPQLLLVICSIATATPVIIWLWYMYHWYLIG